MPKSEKFCRPAARSKRSITRLKRCTPVHAPRHEHPGSHHVPCSLRDLVNLPELGLEAVGRGDLEQQVTRIEVIEDLFASSERLDGALLLIISERSLVDGRDVADLAARVSTLGAAAVGVSSSLPDAFRDALQSHLGELGVAVASFPGPAFIPEIVNFVGASEVNPAATNFRRLMSLQRSLVASLSANDPVHAITKALAKGCGGAVGVTDSQGAVEAASGVMPLALFRKQIGDHGASEIVIDVEGWHGLALRLNDESNGLHRWLLVVGRRPQFPDAFVHSATEVAASLLDATYRAEAVGRAQDRAVRSSALAEALALKPHESTDSLTGRAATFGIDFVDEARVVVVRQPKANQRKRPTQTELLDRVYEAFSDPHSAVLVELRDSLTVALVQGGTRVISRGTSTLTKGQASVIVGIGRPIRHIGDVPVSHRDAVFAANQAQRARTSQVLSFDEFDFTSKVLASVPRQQMGDLTSALLGPIKERPILLEALTAYFENQLDVMASSSALFIHHNTMRYRLAKIEELMGASLKSGATIAALHLALTAEAADRGQDAGAAPLRPARQRQVRNVDAAASDSPVEPPAWISDADGAPGVTLS